ncbi:nucleotidyl transferase AbiEii/AbiGii toxin family protein [Patescibacteria group bacterium]|nr:nucleotidyl transferase AbiEii/AbiGii toxin family protein [Patescibacteria group bacterium]
MRKSCQNRGNEAEVDIGAKSGSFITSNMNNKFFVETLPKNTAHLITMFQNRKPDFLKYFYLSGGTALSLQIGHRESEDLDFFI